MAIVFNEITLKLDVQYKRDANEANFFFWRDQSPPNYTWRTLTPSYVFNIRPQITTSLSPRDYADGGKYKCEECLRCDSKWR